MDVLVDLLQRSRAQGAGFTRSILHGDVAVSFPAHAGLAVHVVVEGDVDLSVSGGGASIALSAGDVALVQGSVEHSLGSSTPSRTVPLAEVLAAGESGEARSHQVGDAGLPASAAFFCGAYLFHGDLCDCFLDALPEVLPLRPAAGGSLRGAVDLLAREIVAVGPGQQVILDRLLDVVLVHVLRRYFAEQPASAPNWFRALLDDRLGAALQALHADPAHPWTVGELASRASLSRGAFARRFSDLVGTAPLAYLTEWRMALAREQLRDTDDSLAVVARSVGYRSEFSFAAAFKRELGVPPGKWRTMGRQNHRARNSADV